MLARKTKFLWRSGDESRCHIEKSNICWDFSQHTWSVKREREQRQSTTDYYGFSGGLCNVRANSDDAESKFLLGILRALYGSEQNWLDKLRRDTPNNQSNKEYVCNCSREVVRKLPCRQSQWAVRTTNCFDLLPNAVTWKGKALFIQHTTKIQYTTWLKLWNLAKWPSRTSYVKLKFVAPIDTDEFFMPQCKGASKALIGSLAIYFLARQPSPLAPIK